MKLDQFFDSSKLTCYMTCPRKFFFEYVLEWRRDGGTFHLDFGTAWHKAMEVLFTDMRWLQEKDIRAKALADAFTAFNAYYNEHCDEPIGAKNPAKALEALESFIKHYAGANWTPVAVEVGGVVPISSTSKNEIVFRIDALIRDADGRLWVVDHKTASQNSVTWSNQWLLSHQMLNYIWAAKCYYGLDEVAGALVNGVFFTKEIQHNQVMVYPQLGILENHLSSMNTEIELCKKDLALLETELEAPGEIMKSFHRRTISCTDFGTCPYHGLCLGWDNPLCKKDCPPPGFSVHSWDPLASVATAKVQHTELSKREGLQNELHASLSVGDCETIGGITPEIAALGEL